MDPDVPPPLIGVNGGMAQPMVAQFPGRGQQTAGQNSMVDPRTKELLKNKILNKKRVLTGTNQQHGTAEENAVSGQPPAGHVTTLADAAGAQVVPIQFVQTRSDAVGVPQPYPVQVVNTFQPGQEFVHQLPIMGHPYSIPGAPLLTAAQMQPMTVEATMGQHSRPSEHVSVARHHSDPSMVKRRIKKRSGTASPQPGRREPRGRTKASGEKKGPSTTSLFKKQDNTLSAQASGDSITSNDSSGGQTPSPHITNNDHEGMVIDVVGDGDDASQHSFHEHQRVVQTTSLPVPASVMIHPSSTVVPVPVIPHMIGTHIPLQSTFSAPPQAQIAVDPTMMRPHQQQPVPQSPTMKTQLGSSLSSPAAPTSATHVVQPHHRNLQPRGHRGLERLSRGIPHRPLSEDQLIHTNLFLNPHLHKPLGQSSSAGALLTADPHPGRSPRRSASPSRTSPLPMVFEGHEPRRQENTNDDDEVESVADSVSTNTTYSRAGPSPDYQRQHAIARRVRSAPTAHTTSQVAFDQIAAQQALMYEQEMAELRIRQQKAQNEFMGKKNSLELQHKHEQQRLQQLHLQLQDQHAAELEMIRRAREDLELKQKRQKDQLIMQARNSLHFPVYPPVVFQAGGMAPVPGTLVYQPGQHVAGPPPLIPQQQASQSEVTSPPHASTPSSLQQEPVSPVSPGSSVVSPPPTSSPICNPHATALVYDTLMLKHQCTCFDQENHPERAGRLQSIWARLQEVGLVMRCQRLKSRRAQLQEIQSVHSDNHAHLFGGNCKKLDKKMGASRCFVNLKCGGVGVDDDTIWHEQHTAPAARMAAGCVIELATQVARGDVKNGFAIVRPPGHHAESRRAMAFCYFNNVAIAAQQLLNNELAQRILIFDWSVHHGNGTQQAFYDSSSVLYMSIHRYDDGHFFPGTGAARECGSGAGVGMTVNIPFNGGLAIPYGDQEYLAAFRTVVLPIAKKFSPDVILISAGFDAMEGHSPQLGGYSVSAACFGYITSQLMKLTTNPGKVVLALEGGYELRAICDASEVCVRALLSEKIPDLSAQALETPPNMNAVKSIQDAINAQIRYWPSLRRTINRISIPEAEASRLERVEDETITALATLSMTGKPQEHDV